MNEATLVKSNTLFVCRGRRQGHVDPEEPLGSCVLLLGEALPRPARLRATLRLLLGRKPA